MTLKLILGALGALNAFFAVVNLYIGITGPSPLNFVVGVVNAAIAAAIIYAAAEV